ncbi:MurNAc alpha-1-phosphate uridylyltransferase [Mariprofundus micogutta]|uniref:MurNAc alpha-1-phosphate uridylyltransferase n=1 Tax=Mariprofundus micogutta TaxID=1921010 RepID=A0A1L8CQF5_9PROT|nr:nucleotidyltransferase family protein [Mariprofundus micogutta]GAV21059.1 MurNAc alpha-1-phosphate uridylyltransferase [Mariprofundus micogutta]
MMTQHVDRAVVLAAGLGTRLKWLTNHRPKALMLVAGEPVITHVIRRLVAQGVQDIAVNTFHHADQMKHFLGDGSKFGCRLMISDEEHLLDSGGGVKKALELLPGDGPFAICNADVLSDINVQQLAAVLPDAGVSIGLVPNPSHHLHGDFALKQGYVMADGDEKFTFSGVSVWHEAGFEKYKVGDIFSLTQPMRELITEKRCAGLVCRGQWFDIGRPRDLMRANRFMSVL